jgi:DNA-nicking Smr family endonuclease
VSYPVGWLETGGAAVDEDDGPEHAGSDEPAQLPIDGVLDLHAFSPRETPDLVADYLDACLERGILTVRIIHGKGIGVQRERVHQVLRRHPAVMGFHHPTDEGGWGATVVQLQQGGATATERSDG